MKTTKSDLIIKHFFGIPGVIDEHVRSEIGKASVKAIVAVAFFYFMLTLHFFLLIGVITAVIGIELHKQGVIYKEVSPQNKQKSVHKLISKFVISLPILFLFLWIANVAFDSNGQNFWKILFTWEEIKPAVKGIITYVILMLIIGRYQIRVVRDDD